MYSPPWSIKTDAGRCSALRREAAVIVARGVGGRIVAGGEPIDRMYLNVYVPMLQSGAGKPRTARSGQPYRSAQSLAVAERMSEAVQNVAGATSSDGECVFLP